MLLECKKFFKHGNMVFISNGNLEIGANVSHKEQTLLFDLFKAFDKIFGMIRFFFFMCKQHVLSYHLM